MAVYEDREAFIPYSRTDIVEMCISEGQLSEADGKKFREFCQILAAYFHFQFHHTLERIKYNFAPFNPDSDTKLRDLPDRERKKEMLSRLVRDFEDLVEKANYYPLSQESLQRAFKEKTLIELKTEVDFEDFDEVVFYCRGDIYKITWVRKALKFFRKVPVTIDIFERVALLLKTKEESYFKTKKIDIEKLNFTPGKIYLYLYKNIPKFDLEFLFPNVKTSMTLKDRLMFGIPAIGAAIPAILKVLPQLLLIVATVLFLVFGSSALTSFQVSQDDVQNVMPVLVATMSIVMTLGGLAFKQYSSYKTKQIQFQKNVTEALFFRNLAINAGVFQSLLDSAEEEETKEIILVFYHLLTSREPLTAEKLDDLVEKWMEEKFDTKIDFDINGPLQNLEKICGRIVKEGQEEANISELPLLTYDRQGNCIVLSLDEAKIVIDYIWDNAFKYARSTQL